VVEYQVKLTKQVPLRRPAVSREGHSSCRKVRPAALNGKRIECQDTNFTCCYLTCCYLVKHFPSVLQPMLGRENDASEASRAPKKPTTSYAS
jgi:hypothetical protein